MKTHRPHAVIPKGHQIFWQRAEKLREATRGREFTPSEDLIREDRDRDHREDNRDFTLIEPS